MPSSKLRFKYSPEDISEELDNSGNEDYAQDYQDYAQDYQDYIEEEEDVEEEFYEPPPVGTEICFDLDTCTNGLYVNIYFTQAESGLSMHCDVSAQAGTDAASFFPNEFEDPEVSYHDYNEGDANVIENNDEDVENPDSHAQENTDEENNVEDNRNDTQSPSDENVGNDDEDTETNNVENEDETDEYIYKYNHEDKKTGQRPQTRGSCTRDMPHLYLLLHTECCHNTNAAGCESTEAYKLGCLDKTGIDSNHKEI